MSWIKKWLEKRRIRSCSHPVPWIVLDRSPNLWWRAFFTLEFYEGDDPPKTPRFTPWCHARHLKCRKCGGTLNEILLGEKWLKAKQDGRLDSMTYPIKELAKGCGTIGDYL